MPIDQPLNEERYKDIRKRIAERRLARDAQKALKSYLVEGKSQSFASVDAFMEHLDSLVDDTD